MISDFIGIPFLDKGRDFKGLDCYGLCKLFYEKELDIIIPDVIANPNQPKLAYMEYLENINQYWETSKEPILNSIVAMCTNLEHPNLVTHFGVLIEVDGKMKILHTFKGSNSHIVDLDNPAYINKIKGFHKWHY